VLEMDPPEHTKYRTLVNRYFAPSMIAQMSQLISEAIDRNLAVLDEPGAVVDFTEQIASRVPFEVMASIVGIDPVEAEHVIPWANAVAASEDPEYRPTPDHVVRAKADYVAYCHQVVADRRAHPEDGDLLSGLIAHRDDDGAGLSDDELANYVELLLTGGSETTRHLMSHLVHLLLSNPDQLENYLGGQVDEKAVVSEVLRYFSPVMHHSRLAISDVMLGETMISSGDRVTLWMISANHDETVFEDPERFDVTRTPDPGSSFGSGGPHFCLGAQLAQLEGRMMLQALKRILPELALTGEPSRMRSNFFNGIKHLSIRRESVSPS